MGGVTLPCQMAMVSVQFFKKWYSSQNSKETFALRIWHTNLFCWVWQIMDWHPNF